MKKYISVPRIRHRLDSGKLISGRTNYISVQKAMTHFPQYALILCLLPVVLGDIQSGASQRLNASIRQSGCTRLRKEVMDLSKSEWTRFVKAVLKIHETPKDGGDSIFTKYVRFHASYVLQWHGGQYFLPAHRQMLWEFESVLREVYPDVTIPYYDWSINNRRWVYDDIWKRIGGANGGPIPNKPFKDWRAALPGDHLVTRTMIFGNPTDIFGRELRPFESRRTLDIVTSLTGLSFQQIANYVEVIHGLPHIEIGGDMRDGRYSPSDPVFYLHHGFVDKIWRDWQSKGAGDRFDGFHRGQTVSIDEVMNPPEWGRTVKDILDDISNCVVYQEPSRRQGSSPQAAFAAPAAASQPLQDSSSSGDEKKFAEEKANDGKAYKEKVEEIKEEQESVLEGAKFSNSPPEMVQSALETKKVVQAMLSDVLKSDIENPDAVLEKKEADIEKEGAEQAESM